MVLAVPPIPNGTLPVWQCIAHSSRTGNRCRQKAIRGGTVCKMHGGRAPQVKAAAEARIRELAEGKALNRVEQLIDYAENDSVRLAAARDILDRAGFTAKQRHELAGDVTFTLRIDRGGDSNSDDEGT